MKKLIDSFYVLDFDRCLGNVDACFGLLQEVVDKLSVFDGRLLQDARLEVEQSGGSFDVLSYLEDYCPGIDLTQIEKRYIDESKKSPGALLELGAAELVNFFVSTNRYFCVMSYGNIRWQTLKIIASGLADVPRIIVHDKQKSRYITKWIDRKDGGFLLPGECFGNGKPRRSKEVILVDDKIGAFDGLPSGARGYLVQNFVACTGGVNLCQTADWPIKQVSRLDEIIGLEV